MFDPNLNTGAELNNRELCSIFMCSSQGGMRKSKITNSLVIISNHVKSIYDDRWLDETFHYTGMGMSGAQSLNFMQNKTLAESRVNGISVHLFEVFYDKIYTYIGPVELAGDPYQETQPDQDGRERLVWMFPLRLTAGQGPLLAEATLATLEERKIKSAKRLTDSELKARAARDSRQHGGQRPITATHYTRSTWVSEYAKRAARGICQLCGKNAPFKNKDGEPYLETHHVIWLSEGGRDSIDNTVALCPNCHRKMHVLNLRDDKQKLLSFGVQ